MRFLTALAGAVLAATTGGVCARGQGLPEVLRTEPVVATAGEPSLAFRLPSYTYTGDESDFTVLWNGSERPTRRREDGSMETTLTADDLLRPGLGEINKVFLDSGFTGTATWWLPVGIGVKAKDLVWDSRRKLLYASVKEATALAAAGAVIAIDPDSGAVARSLALDGEPGPLAISDNQAWLYVGLTAAKAVTRIDLDTFAAGGRFDLSSSIAGTNLTPDALAVMPGKPDTVAVGHARGTYSGSGAIAIYDNGVRRAADAPVAASRILWESDAATLYAGVVCNPYCYSGPHRLTVTEGGLVNSAPLGVSGAVTLSSDGRLYMTSGEVADAATLKRIAYSGVTGPGFRNNGRLLFLFVPGYPSIDAWIVALDPPTLRPLGAQPISGAAPYTTFLDLGDGRVAFPTEGHILVFRTPLALPAPRFTADAVVHGAAFVPGSIAPGELISVFGTHLGPDRPRLFSLNAPAAVEPVLGRTEVLFDSLPGTVLYTSPGQINVVVPYGVAGRERVRVQVRHAGVPSAQMEVPVAPASPGFFTAAGSGTGQAAALNQNMSHNSAANPAARGSIIVLYGTGGGATSTTPRDHVIARAAEPLLAGVRVQIGGRDAEVLYAGSAPGLISGVFQINARIPAGVTPGNVPVVVTVDGRSSRTGVTIAVAN